MTVNFEYIFLFPDSRKKSFRIELDSQLLYKCKHTEPLPTWTALQFQQCRHCQLSVGRFSHCPVAANVAELVLSFRDIASYSRCTMSCISEERTVSKQTGVQHGLSSIMGLVMAASDCPSMEILRPMTRFHLPFASIEESIFRAIGTYMLRQYFIGLDGGEADFALAGITRCYEQVEQVNRGILQRIRKAANLDADKNAIIILHSIAQILEMEIDRKLESLRPYFFPS